MSKYEYEGSEKKDIKKATAGGFVWSFGERFLAQLITALVTIILARILAPDDFGVVSIVTVFIMICNVFVTNGIGSALVQRKEVDDLDYNTALCLNLGISFFIYILLFLVAPFIAGFYRMEILAPVIRVMGIRIPIAAINSVQQAYIRRKMEFRKFFFATLGGSIVSGIVGVILAVSGAGVWAIVAQYLTNVCTDTVMLSLFIDWRPRLEFSAASGKRTFSYGSKLLFAELIATLGNNLRVLLVGHSFGASDLAFFDQGQKYPALLTTNANTAINQVMLPVFSRKQDEIKELKNMLRNSVVVGTAILGPMLVGFMAIAPSFVSIVLTDKWLPCIPYLRIFCLYYLTRPLEALCGEAIKGMGKTGWVLIKLIVVNVSSIIFLIISVFVMKSTLFLAYTMLANMTVSVILNWYFSSKYLGYTLLEEVCDFLTGIFPAVIMGVIVVLMNNLPFGRMPVFIIQILTGVMVYILLSYFLNRKVFTMIISCIPKIGSKMKMKQVTK